MKSPKELNLETKIINKLKNFPTCIKLVQYLFEDEELQAMQDYANNVSIKRLGFNDHGPVHMRQVANNAIKMLNILHSNGIQTSLEKEEIAHRVDMPVNKLVALMKSSQSTISIETPANQKDDTSKIADFIVDETHLTPDTKVTQENLLEDVRKMLNQLNPKEKDVLIMRYGLDNNGQKKTLDEIGSRYGVSRERIRQIETRAIAKLKKLCRNKSLSINLKNYIGLE